MSLHSRLQSQLDSDARLSLRAAVLGGVAAAAAGAGVAYTLLRRRLAQRDSPQAPASAREVFDTLTSRSHARRPDPLDDEVDIRPGRPEDAESVAVQMHESFNSWNASVGLAPEFSSLDLSRLIVRLGIEHELCLVAVRKSDGTVLASAFNNEVDLAHGAVSCGPWSARWGSTARGIGRKIVSAIVDASLRHGARSLRLVQIQPNLPALALYSSLGFQVREPLLLWTGAPREDEMARVERDAPKEWSVRDMVEKDVLACDAMFSECNGISRVNGLTNDVRDKGVPKKVLVDAKGRVIAYCTGLTVIGHIVAPSLQALQVLLVACMRAHLSSVPSEPPQLHTMSRLYPQLERWLQRAGVRVERGNSLMVLGEWQPVAHEKFIYCPTIGY